MAVPDIRTPHVQHSVLEVFTRVWLRELSDDSGGQVTLANVPDHVLDAWLRQGFSAIWLMGVWTLGHWAREESLTLPHLLQEYADALPGWTQDDVLGSPYAVAEYTVSESLGGARGLASLRKRLNARGMALWLDFVPNHTAWDHPWVKTRPDLYVHLKDGSMAAGKDPYFPPWTDTAQLDHRSRETQDALTTTLLEVAELCDGVRCDMAMLTLPDVMARTWAHAAPPRGTPATGSMWSQAIPRVRQRHPSFVFMAETYWDMEYRLQLLGFDFTYDKTFHDRLLEPLPVEAAAQLDAVSEYQARSVRFLENHDEARLIQRVGPDHARAATTVAMTVPGLHFLQEGQREGRRVKLPIRLGRRPRETPDPTSVAFHEALFKVMRHPALTHGCFLRLHPSAPTVLAHRWEHPRGTVLVVVNLGKTPAPMRLHVPLHGAVGQQVRLTCLLTSRTFTMPGDTLVDPQAGLQMELPPWAVHAFTLTT